MESNTALPDTIEINGVTYVKREQNVSRQELRNYYNDGVRAACNKCLEWADMAGGGDGRFGEEYRNLAKAIGKLQK